MLTTRYSLLATAVLALCAGLRAQPTPTPTTGTVNKVLATDRITAELVFGTGRTLTGEAGSTFAWNGVFGGTPTSGTLNLSALTLTLGTPAGLTLTNATGLPTAGLVDDAVTFAKLQNLATDRLIGRDTALAGDPEEITVGGGLEFTGTLGLQRSALTGDITAPAGGNATTLATVNANVGTFGSATQASQVTVNAKGLVTAASSVTVTPAVGSITGLGTGVATFLSTPSSANLAAAVTDETGTGAVVLATSPTLVTPALGTPSAAVLTNATGLPTAGLVDDAVTFAKLQNLATDRLIGRDTALAGDPEEITVGGGLEFTGTLGLQRSALTGAITAPAGSNATVLGSFTLAALNTAISDADVATGGGTATGTNTGDQTITLTGDVTGAGIGTFAATIAADAVTFAKLQNLATNSLVGRDTALAGDAESILLDDTLEMDGLLNLQRAALTGDITAPAGGNATTLATVNANVGTFGSATAASQVTVNAKGLVTAASSVTVTPAVGSITGLGTGVAPALGAAANAAGGFPTTDGAATLTNKILTAPDINAGTADSLTSLSLRSTGAAFDLLLATSSVFTLNRTLNLLTGDASRTVTLSGDPTLADWFNQSVKTTASPTFVTVTAALAGNATTATTLATPRAIYGNNFDGSAALTQVIASTYGGTGNGFTKFTGPTTAEKTFTLPDASSTLLYAGGPLGTPSSGTVTNLTGTASININGTVGATTPSTVAATTLTTTVADGSFGLFAKGATNQVRIAGYASGSSFIDATDVGSVGYTPLSIRGSTVDIAPSGTSRGLFSSTGLTVTGTLGASGNVWSGNQITDPTIGTTDGATLESIGSLILSRNIAPSLYVRRRTSDGSAVQFYRDTTQVGSISVTTTATAYNTSSDGRLKRDIREVDHAEVRRIVGDIRIRQYLWNANDKKGVGPIAQELAAVHPLLVDIGAVTPGDGQPVDYAKWQAIRDRKARVDARATRNEAKLKAHKLALEEHQKEVQRVSKLNEEMANSFFRGGKDAHEIPKAPAEPVLETHAEDNEKDFIQWQVDLSKLTPFLVDYAQQESKRLDALEARVAALEARATP